VEGQKETHSGIAALSGRFQVIERRVDDLAARLETNDQRLDYKREVLATHDRRLTALETEALDVLHARITALEVNNDQLAAIREELSVLTARIADALPTEADQDLSAQLRADEEARHGDGNG
jgi:chromosome segregation ATPase